MITANWDLSPNLSPAVSFRGQRPVKPYQELPRSPSSEESAWVSPKTIIGAISLRATGIWRSVEIRSSCSDPSPWARATFTDGWIYEWTHYIGEARASPTQLILTPWYSSAPPALQKKKKFDQNVQTLNCLQKPSQCRIHGSMNQIKTSWSSGTKAAPGIMLQPSCLTAGWIIWLCTVAQAVCQDFRSIFFFFFFESFYF